MPKTKISEFSSTPASNTDIDSINIAEGCAPSGINDAIRELMAQLKDFQVGSAGDPVTVGGVLTVQAGAVGTPAITTAGDTNTGMFFPAADTIAFAEGGAEAARFDSSGNLGIGTTSPSGRLHVANTGTAGTTADNLAVYFSSTNRNSNVYILAKNTDGSTLNFGDGDSSTVGRISYDHASNYMAFDANGSEGMRLTSTGLGIGTSSPAAKLDIVGSSSNQIRVGTATSENYRIGRNASDGFLDFYGSQTGYQGYRFGGIDGTWATINSSGNLGLGVTPSAWGGSYKAFQITNAARSLAATGAGSGDLTLAFNAVYDSTDSRWEYATTGDAAVRYSQTGAGIHAWYNAASGTAGNAITFTQAMTLDASGNLGLGTTSPDDITSGYTTVDVRGSTGGGLRLGVAGGNNMAIYASASTSVIEASGSSALQLVVNSAERARIDSSGNLLVNSTTSTPASITAHKLVVERTASVFGAAFGYAPDSTARTQVTFYNSNGAVGTISTNGSATSYNTTSDQRLKDNIVNAPEFGSVIDSIKVRSFDWKTDQTHQRAGFIAQELVTVAPEAVHQPEDPDKMMAVDYSKLVPMLVKEIQSLRKRLADAGI